MTLNLGRSKDHKLGQQEHLPLLHNILFPGPLTLAKKFYPAKRWGWSRTERRSSYGHFPHTAIWQSTTQSSSLLLPGYSKTSFRGRQLKFKTCHEDAGNAAMMETTVQHPVSFTGEGWKRRALQLLHRHDGTTTNSAGMWVAVNQQQNTGPPGHKTGLTDSWMVD